MNTVVMLNRLFHKNTDYAQTVKNTGKYLFCYFIGDKPEEERVRFAVSDDGYNFSPVNNNKEIIVQTKGTKCMRDPFILRGNDNCFYIIATDMKSSDGWHSNHGMVSWKSNDLINWEDECAIDFHKFKSTQTADRVWAPEALYDKEREEYFVYYSIHNKSSKKPLSIWYSYTKDFKSFTEPQEFFVPYNKHAAIDADITEKDGNFYMYYKDEKTKTICGAVSDKIAGPYISFCKPLVALTKANTEAACMFKIADSDTYVLLMDMYTSGKYFMQQTDDMINFKEVKSEDFDLSFHPRHGSMISITDEEYDRLIATFKV